LALIFGYGVDFCSETTNKALFKNGELKKHTKNKPNISLDSEHSSSPIKTKSHFSLGLNKDKNKLYSGTTSNIIHDHKTISPN
jgi:hypothetical protein